MFEIKKISNSHTDNAYDNQYSCVNEVFGTSIDYSLWKLEYKAHYWLYQRVYGKGVAAIVKFEAKHFKHMGVYCTVLYSPEEAHKVR